MKKIERFKRKVTNFFYDHYILKAVLREIGGVIIGATGALLFAIGFKCFILPVDGFSDIHFATGGVSGISQNIALVVRMAGGNLTDAQLNAIGYAGLNVPLLIFAFFAIGKRFSIQSAINVGLSSLFLVLIPDEFIRGIAQVGAHDIASTPADLTGALGCSLLARPLLGGAIIGVSSAITFKGDFSCGGVDIITYYLSMRKSTSVGKFGISINICIIILYSILSVASFGWTLNGLTQAIGQFLISVVYLLVVNIVVDIINLRNKKIKVEIITKNKDMGDLLVAHFPHAATSLKSQGVYSGAEEETIWMIVSSNEVNAVVKLARQIDSHAFISVTSLIQVYGNFFIKPIN